MSTLTIESKLRSALRAAAHPLRPVVQIGDKGLSDAVVKEIDRALAAHGLIKVSATGERGERQAMLADICERLGCAPVHHLGKVLILWRPTEDDPSARKLLGDKLPMPASALGVQPRKADEPYVPKKLAAEGRSEAPVRRKPAKPVRDESSLSPRERYLGAAGRKSPARKAAGSGTATARGSALSLRAGARGPRPGSAPRPAAAGKAPRTGPARRTAKKG
ncbi:hypothetical protein FOZ76_20970 [Verticiella sediminum]|uniref:CRM domain-containing protein n=1 Tax=Verticiella sediminum TaxID=1247510 RepID=A0A556ABQ2_9BURK|nr:YhbY family RNA-binding protein [Verticiella sediminum]TSH90301.1 hypothetical protein FOZ76_20970 [Verticiella sediminum]